MMTLAINHRQCNNITDHDSTIMLLGIPLMDVERQRSKYVIPLGVMECNETLMIL